MKSFINMDEFKKNIPSNVITQLRSLMEDSDLPESESSLNKIAESWLMKQAMFNRIIEHGEFKRTEIFKKDSPYGCIAVTLSGSILSIGPLNGNSRKVIYTSIDWRNDVPKTVVEEKAELAEDITVGKPASFKIGKIKNTSEIYNLSLPKFEGKGEEEVKRIIEINQLLLDNFLQVNNNTFKTNYYDNELFTRNELFKKWIVIEWFVIGGFDKHIFMARVKILWLELFSKLYKELFKNKQHFDDFENIFVDFTNERFTKFIDEYKWYESEKKNQDIGLLKALEEIPSYKKYWDFLDDFINEVTA